MSPWKLLRIYTRANKLVELFTAASRDWEMRHRTGADTMKSIFASKTFWFNVLTAGVELTGVLPLPAGTVALIAAVANIGLRFLSSQPVSLTGK